MSEHKFSFVLISGELEKIQAAAMIASVAAQLGTKVQVFASMEALLAFKKDVVEKKAFKTAGELGKGMLNANVPLFVDLFKQAKESGNLKMYACSMVMDMLGLELKDFVDVFDDSLGVTAFLDMAEGTQVVIF